MPVNYHHNCQRSQEKQHKQQEQERRPQQQKESLLSDNYDRANAKKRFQCAILACFEHYETDLCHRIIRYNGTGDAGVQPEEPLTFQKFHQMATNMAMIDSNPGAVYAVYRNSAEKWLQKFAAILVGRLKHPFVGDDHLTVAKLLLEFWINFRRNVIPFLSRGMMNAERLRQKSSNEMDVGDMTCHLFVRNVLRKSSIGSYIAQLLIPYFLEKHLCTHNFVRQRSNFEQQLYDQPDPCGYRKWITDDQMPTMLSLMAMLVDLDHDIKVVYTKMFEIPFLEQHLPKFFHQLMERLIGPMTPGTGTAVGPESAANQLTMLEYMQFGTLFLQYQMYMLEMFGVPADSRLWMNRFSTYLLFTRNIHHIVYEKQSGMSSLLDSHSYEKMAKIVQLIYGHYRRAKQPDLMDGLTEFIAKYCSKRLEFFRESFDCRKRHTAINFVLAVFQEREHWDTVQTIVFQNDVRFVKQIKEFYINLVKINDRVPQALAYFLHDLLSSLGSVLTAAAAAATTTTTTANKSSNLVDHLTTGRGQLLLEQLCSLIAFLPDVNQFYDFTKHYFTCRLLTGTSLLPFQKELEYLDKVNQVIRVNHLSTNVCLAHSPLPPPPVPSPPANDRQQRREPEVAAVARNNNNQEQQQPPQHQQQQPQPPLTEFHQFFIQNLNDFRNIKKDYDNSKQFFESNYPRASQIRHHRVSWFLESFSVLHAGYWKFMDYEQCWMPQRIIRSWQDFEERYVKQKDGRTLLVNTRYSQAKVAMWLAAIQDPMQQPKAKKQPSTRQKLMLTMTLNQLAIVMVFNDANKCSINYDAMFQQTRFYRECNLRNALLSLIYCGLIAVSNTGGGNLYEYEFQVNDVSFCKLVKDSVVLDDLSNYELVNFYMAKPLDPNVAVAQFLQIVQVISDGHDLTFQASTVAVEEQNLHNILQNSHKLRTPTFNHTPSSSNQSASGSSGWELRGRRRQQSTNRNPQMGASRAQAAPAAAGGGSIFDNRNDGTNNQLTTAPTPVLGYAPSGVGATASGTSMLMTPARASSSSSMLNGGGAPRNSISLFDINNHQQPPLQQLQRQPSRGGGGGGGSGAGSSLQAESNFSPAANASNSLSSSPSSGVVNNESPIAIDRLIRVEAIIVRVLKKVKKMANILNVYRAVLQESQRQAAKVREAAATTSAIATSGSEETPPAQQSSIQMFGFTVEEVKRGVLRLLDKRYIRRTEQGGFEYIVD